MTPLETTLVVHGTPKGKGRMRFVKATGHVHTPQETINAEARVRAAWAEAGAVHLGDGPIAATLTLVTARPGSHWRVKGGLTAAGIRSWAPTKKPDLDNALKLVLDALNKRAFKDDAQVVRAMCLRRWAEDGEREHVHLTLMQMPVPADVAAAIAVLDAAREARTSPIVHQPGGPDAADDTHRSAA